MHNLIIMYHYVRDDKNFKALGVKAFYDQVKYLKSQYRLITLAELIATRPTDKTCILTFDDGLKDGYTNALPILVKLAVPATFFIPTKILISKQILPAHQLHCLFAKLGAKKLALEFNHLASNSLQITNAFPKNRLDDLLTSNIKHLVNHGPQAQVQPILDKIFNRYFSAQSAFNQIYLTPTEIIELRQQGMEIGLHGHEHLWLGKANDKVMKQDLSQSIKTFRRVFHYPPQFISYPYGSYNQSTLRLLPHLKLAAGVTTIKKINRNLAHPYELGRYDCIDIIAK